MRPPVPDRRGGDRHRLVSLSRLTDPGTDTWLRGYAKATGQGVMRVVTTALQHYRHHIDPPKEPK